MERDLIYFDNIVLIFIYNYKEEKLHKIGQQFNNYIYFYFVDIVTHYIYKY